MGNHIRDEDNPEFLFSLTSNFLLSKILKRQIDCFEFASIEMAKRGCNLNGNWIGFDQALQEHKSRIRNTSKEVTEIGSVAVLSVKDVFNWLNLKSFRRFYTLVDQQFEVIEIALRKELKDYLEQKPVEIVKIEFEEVDGESLEGIITFIITLKGTVENLKLVAGLDHFFIYDWDEEF
ncbi:MAG: hypothetical protein MUF42_17725 [Cytophagaceae bacterium]|jgi:hypothetical protein|nr:hypothetical protein [Cytophagaceae bacterium]